MYSGRASGYSIWSSGSVPMLQIKYPKNEMSKVRNESCIKTTLPLCWIARGIMAYGDGNEKTWAASIYLAHQLKSLASDRFYSDPIHLIFRFFSGNGWLSAHQIMILGVAQSRRVSRWNFIRNFLPSSSSVIQCCA